MSENPSQSLSFEHKSRKQLIQEIYELRTMLNAERESRRTEISEMLRESERKYHTIFEQAAIGICRVSFHDARWIEFNDAFQNMLGYTKEELLQNPWPQITHPEDVDLDLIPFRQMAAGELESYMVEKRFIHKKGHHVWARLTLSLVRNAKEEPDYEIAVVENINERKQTEESLRRLSQYPGENPHPVLRIAADSTLLYANKAASDCLVLLGSTGEHISEVMTALASKAQQSSQTVESEVTLPDNRTFGFFAVRPHGEDYANIYGIDLSKRKQMEEALRKSEKQLLILNNELELRVEQRTRELQETQSKYLHAEKLSAIGQLSASIAHEFNNPLQGIRTILKGLKRRAILEEEDKELLDLAIYENERMTNLIRGLQDFNRPSSEKKTEIDIHASIDSLLLLFKSDFKRKNIRLELNYENQLPQTLAIPDQIKQVFLNLLNNAADACREGGLITITTWQEKKKIGVAIKDNGVGIKPENKDLIFQPFFTTKSEIKGTGLGLSVCYGIIQNHQGEIRVDSQPREGSTFTVYLPVEI